jgi:hypothetical protein
VLEVNNSIFQIKNILEDLLYDKILNLKVTLNRSVFLESLLRSCGFLLPRKEEGGKSWDGSLFRGGDDHRTRGGQQPDGSNNVGDLPLREKRERTERERRGEREERERRGEREERKREKREKRARRGRGEGEGRGERGERGERKEERGKRREERGERRERREERREEREEEQEDQTNRQTNKRTNKTSDSFYFSFDLKNLRILEINCSLATQKHQLDTIIAFFRNEP